jgi:hypothetical protein
MTVDVALIVGEGISGVDDSLVGEIVGPGVSLVSHETKIRQRTRTGIRKIRISCLVLANIF